MGPDQARLGQGLNARSVDYGTGILKPSSMLACNERGGCLLNGAAETLQLLSVESGGDSVCSTANAPGTTERPMPGSDLLLIPVEPALAGTRLGTPRDTLCVSCGQRVVSLPRAQILSLGETKFVTHSNNSYTLLQTGLLPSPSPRRDSACTLPGEPIVRGRLPGRRRGQTSGIHTRARAALHPLRAGSTEKAQ